MGFSCFWHFGLLVLQFLAKKSWVFWKCFFGGILGLGIAGCFYSSECGSGKVKQSMYVESL